jgi:hypothetical protein
MIVFAIEPEKVPWLVQAVVAWTGYRREMIANRDDSKVVRQFGAKPAAGSGE